MSEKAHEIYVKLLRGEATSKQYVEAVRREVRERRERPEMKRALRNAPLRKRWWRR